MDFHGELTAWFDNGSLLLDASSSASYSLDFDADTGSGLAVMSVGSGAGPALSPGDVLVSLVTNVSASLGTGGTGGTGVGGGAAVVDAADWLRTLTLVIKTCLMGLIIVASVFGNLLVIISVARFRKLRIITNYFVVSLAMADILVALLAMGFNASVIIFDRWMFGYTMCDMWNSFDVYFSTVSILHLCCISVDRYYAISQPLMYPMKITRKKVAVMLANIWTWPALISYLPINLGWYTTEKHQQDRLLHPDRCEFIVNKWYAVISSSISFWIPCAIMLFMYYRIYKMASRQEKMLLKNADAALVFRQQNQRRSAEMEQHQIHHVNNQSPTTTTTTTTAHDASLSNGPVPSIHVTLAGRQQQQQHQHHHHQPDVLPAAAAAESNGTCPSARAPYCPEAAALLRLDAGGGGGGGGGNNDDHNQQMTVNDEKRRTAPSPPEGKRISGGDRSALLDNHAADGRCSHGTSTPTGNKDKHIQKIRREHKAARTLGIIMGAFVICWLPFFIWYLSFSLCGDYCYCPGIVIEVLFWIGYFNSTLNPLIYAYFNKDFREAFKNTLVCVFCTRCQDPRQREHCASAANYANIGRQTGGGGGGGMGGGGGGGSVPGNELPRIRHSSGDTIAGIERIEHKRLSGVAVQNL